MSLTFSVFVYLVFVLHVTTFLLFISLANARFSSNSIANLTV